MTEASTDDPTPPPPDMQESDVASTTGRAPQAEIPGRISALGQETVGNILSDNEFMVAEYVKVYYLDNHAIQHV